MVKGDMEVQHISGFLAIRAKTLGGSPSSKMRDKLKRQGNEMTEMRAELKELHSTIAKLTGVPVKAAAQDVNETPGKTKVAKKEDGKRQKAEAQTSMYNMQWTPLSTEEIAKYVGDDWVQNCWKLAPDEFPDYKVGDEKSIRKMFQDGLNTNMSVHVKSADERQIFLDMSLTALALNLLLVREMSKDDISGADEVPNMLTGKIDKVRVPRRFGITHIGQSAPQMKPNVIEIIRKPKEDKSQPDSATIVLHVIELVPPIWTISITRFSFWLLYVLADGALSVVMQPSLTILILRR